MGWRDRLGCPGCGRGGVALTDLEVSDFTCARCGAALEVAIPERGGIDRDRQGLWRYAAMLPCPDRADLFGEPQIRVVESPELAELIGARTVWLVDCTGLGTGTFKDLEAQVVLGAHAELDFAGGFSLHSTGNTARAYNRAAALLGLHMTVSVPATNLDKLRGLTGTDERPILAIDAEPTRAAQMAVELARERGSRHLAPPGWKTQGTAALGYLLAERCPDADLIVQTVGAGFGPLGYELGLRRAARIAELRDAPIVSRRGYLFVQPSDTCAVAQMWAMPPDEAASYVPQYPANPFEPTLLSTNVGQTIGQLRGLPGSRVVTVSPAAVMERQNQTAQLLRDAAIRLDAARERATLIALAGLRSPAAAPGATVAVVVTGSAPFERDTSPATGVTSAESAALDGKLLG